MIAIAIITVILAAGFLSQVGSIATAGRAKDMLIATQLARNLIEEQELKIRDTKFENLPKEEKGDFPDPHKRFRFEIRYEKVDFGVLSDLLAKETASNLAADDAEKTPQLMRIFEDYLGKSVRRMEVKIIWEENHSTFTQLLVNYDAEFSTGV
jgi:type II secretory pathway pseudopilin PulG